LQPIFFFKLILISLRIRHYIYILICFIASSKAQGQLAFQNVTHEYGKVSRAKSLLSEFVVTNTGTEEAYILVVDGGAEFAFTLTRKVIKPGESDTLKLFYRPQKPGVFNEEIKVFLSSQNEPVVLKISGEIKEIDPDPLGVCYSFRENNALAYKPLPIAQQRITVINETTGKPIDGAFVQLFSDGSRSNYSYTKVEGETKFTVPPGLYDVRVRADYYKGHKAELYIAKGSELVIKLTPMEDIIPVKDIPDSIPVYAARETLEVVPVKPLPIKDSAVATTPVVTEETETVGGELNPALYGPSNVVFLIDISSSMKEPKKLPLLKRSMKALVSQLRPIDKLTIITYASSTNVLMPPTTVTNKEYIYKLIDSLKAFGLTAANSGISVAYKYNQENYMSGGNNQVILATDGMFPLYKSDQVRIEQFNGSGSQKIVLTVVGFGISPSTAGKLTKLSEAGKGEFIQINSEADADEALLNEIKNRSKK
jgi:Ca-activated chloride channel family protein